MYVKVFLFIFRFFVVCLFVGLSNKEHHILISATGQDAPLVSTLFIWETLLVLVFSLSDMICKELFCTSHNSIGLASLKM